MPARRAEGANLMDTRFPKADRHASAVKAAIVVARPSKARIANGDSSDIP
jgi:hypothetical protein